jgi:hypothetical protein
MSRSLCFFSVSFCKLSRAPLPEPSPVWKCPRLALDNWYSQLPASERQAGRARSMDPGHYYGVATDEAHERVKLRLGSSGQQREVWVKRKVKKKTQSRGTAMLRKTVFGGIAGAAATAHAIMKHAVE